MPLLAKSEPIKSVQARGGGGSFVWEIPVRLATTAAARSDASIVGRLAATASGSTANTAAISEQQVPAACLALSRSGHGAGGGT